MIFQTKRYQLETKFNTTKGSTHKEIFYRSVVVSKWLSAFLEALQSRLFVNSNFQTDLHLSLSERVFVENYNDQPFLSPFELVCVWHWVSSTFFPPNFHFTSSLISTCSLYFEWIRLYYNYCCSYKQTMLTIFLLLVLLFFFAARFRGRLGNWSSWADLSANIKLILLLFFFFFEDYLVSKFKGGNHNWYYHNRL